MKALVLAAGKGRRLNGSAAGRNKCLLPVNGRPLITYSLDTAVGLGLREAVVVVGHLANEVRAALGREYAGLRLEYAEQSEQLGLVHAMECAAPALGGEDFLLLLGDEILVNQRLAGMLALFRDNACFTVCGLLRRTAQTMDLIRRTYAVDMDQDMRIRRLEEKPQVVRNPWQGTGNCMFSGRILADLASCPVNPLRGQRELPGLIQQAVDQGRPVYGFDLCDDYVNINAAEDLEYLAGLLGASRVASAGGARS